MCFSIVTGQRTPTISYVTPNISTTRSSTIDMECSVLWATEYPVLWMKIDKDGKPIPLASGSSLIIRDHRFAMRYDTASATYTLQLKDIQRSDEGRYECQIIVQVRLGYTLYNISQSYLISSDQQQSDPVFVLTSAGAACDQR